MKNRIVHILVLSLFFVLPLISLAGSAPAKSLSVTEGPSVTKRALTKKELRQQKRAQKLNKFIQKRLQKRAAKIEKQRGKQGFGDLDRNLQLAVIFGVAALALIIMSSLISFLSVISAIAWVAALVFLILWLVENV